MKKQNGKVRLVIDDLAVETFSAGGNGFENGTVRGQEASYIQCQTGWGAQCLTAATGNPDCPGCQVSGVASCVWCPADTQTCADCSYTGDGPDLCYW
ncbi:MAG TPA: hypothetical protein VFJ16_24605 [Longimicrobium sp.]|nr:hypothetical protein [Longimicrobium sp.]